MRRRAMLLGLSAIACGPKERPALPSPPAVLSAPELIPGDLDVVVRLDLARVKAALGIEVVSALSRQVLSGAAGAQQTDELVVSSLLAADVVYLAYRPSPSWTPLDRVLALQGHFDPLLRAPLGFSGATDLGADVRYWESRASTPRDGVKRIYALGDRGLAFVSEAEIDAVERTLDGLGSARRLQPPEEATLSIAARPRLLAALSNGSALHDLLQEAKALRLVVDLDADGVSAKVELVLVNTEQAQALAGALQQVVSRLDGRFSSGTVLRAEGDRVVLTAKLSRSQLAPALACLRPAATAGCAW